MYSYVEIANLALSRIGTNQLIDTLGERSKEAEMLDLHMPICRQSVLREFPWNFAAKRAALALISDFKQGRWRYQYALPNDCLFAREIIQCGECLYKRCASDTAHQFELGIDDTLTTRTVLTNMPNAWLCYTADVVTPSLFDSLFIDALAWRLASAIALPLAASADVSRICDAKYQQIIHAAWAQQMNESRITQETDVNFIRGRR